MDKSYTELVEVLRKMLYKESNKVPKNTSSQEKGILISDSSVENCSRVLHILDDHETDTNNNIIVVVSLKEEEKQQ